ncbi:MAG TPA: hypothetical protein VK889_01325 [Solirubrobacterales bacterium]|nr:hypothetical protein [Solirubrobacterales bacterium]
MDPVRSTWTDSRLDDFAVRTDQRFDSIERRMERGFTQVSQDIRELKKEMGGMQRTMVQTTVALAAGMLAGFGGLAGLIATQL